LEKGESWKGYFSWGYFNKGMYLEGDDNAGEELPGWAISYKSELHIQKEREEWFPEMEGRSP